MGEQIVVTPCPSCGGKTLFVGTGGHLTCSWLECKEPIVETAIAQLEVELAKLKYVTLPSGKTSNCFEAYIAFKRENEKLKRVLKEVYEGPHHSAIDATKCPDLVEWTCRVIDAAGDALAEVE